MGGDLAYPDALPVNELPELKDDSLALANRLLFIELKNSFLGKEDKNLTNKLLVELPGILLWAIEGWCRLHQRGHFQSPDSSEGIMASMKNLSSPVSTFIADCCVLGAESKIPSERLYCTYEKWCERTGRHPADSAAIREATARGQPKRPEQEGQIAGLEIEDRLLYRNCACSRASFRRRGAGVAEIAHGPAPPSSTTGRPGCVDQLILDGVNRFLDGVGRG